MKFSISSSYLVNIFMSFQNIENQGGGSVRGGSVGKYPDWPTFSQHLVNTVEKVYHTSKWTYFYIQFAHPNYICFDFDEKD